MKEQGFFEFQTPILTASSPEGARDYLVPSRIHPGKFYALPQAPQQFKQLIMVSASTAIPDRALLSRRGRARRSLAGEFYQLDLEMSFVTQQDVFDAVEPVMRGVFEEFAGGRPVTKEFPQISYAASIRAFGTDKPDLRNPLMIHDVTNVFRDSGFTLFARAIAADPKMRIWAIPARRAAAVHSVIGSMVGPRVKVNLASATSSGVMATMVGPGRFAKNLGPERTSQLKKELNGRLGQLVRVPLPFDEQTTMEVLLAESFSVGRSKSISDS